MRWYIGPLFISDSASVSLSGCLSVIITQRNASLPTVCVTIGDRGSVSSSRSVRVATVTVPHHHYHHHHYVLRKSACRDRCGWCVYVTSATAHLIVFAAPLPSGFSRISPHSSRPSRSIERNRSTLTGGFEQRSVYLWSLVKVKVLTSFFLASSYFDAHVKYYALNSTIVCL